MEETRRPSRVQAMWDKWQLSQMRLVEEDLIHFSCRVLHRSHGLSPVIACSVMGLSISAEAGVFGRTVDVEELLSPQRDSIGDSISKSEPSKSSTKRESALLVGLVGRGGGALAFAFVDNALRGCSVASPSPSRAENDWQLSR